VKWPWVIFACLSHEEQKIIEVDKKGQFFGKGKFFEIIELEE
jgi:hypothetical protein